jgi:hypothetical protein
MALLAEKLKITPNQVTITSIFLGAFAGYFFYFSDLRLNLIGMAMLMVANMMDSADGQLARMTGQTSAIGRWLDGAAEYFWFLSIYTFVFFRMLHEDFSPWIWLLPATAGFLHPNQTALADYYRTLHLMFLKNKKGSEFDRSVLIKEKFLSKSWTKEPFSKFAMLSYFNYTRNQEFLTPKLQKFFALFQEKYSDDIPQKLRDEFREKSMPLMKYANFLTFNWRCIVLFVGLFIGKPWIFFIFELTVMNVAVIYMRYRHESFCAHFYTKLFRNEL